MSYTEKGWGFERSGNFDSSACDVSLIDTPLISAAGRWQVNAKTVEQITTILGLNVLSRTRQ
jgi:hypothetical protein